MLVLTCSPRIIREDRQRRRNKQGNLKILCGVFFLSVGISSIIYVRIKAPGAMIAPTGVLALGGYLVFAGLARV